MNITKITEVNDLINTPAKVNRYTGGALVSKKHFRLLKPTGRVLVMIHEQGHVVLETVDEIAADNYAIDYMLKNGYSLKEIISAAMQLLDEKNPVHRLRLNNMFNRLAKFDFIHNKNNKMKPFINEDPNKELWEEAERADIVSSISNFSIIPKFMQKNMDRWNNRRDVIASAKAQKIRDKGEAKLIAAGAGGEGGGDGSFLNKAGDFVGGLFNKGDNGDTVPTVTEEPKNNTAIYIVVAIVVILAAVGAYIYFKKKKK